MLNLPIPRRSFLDSRLRTQSHESRRLSAGRRNGDTHLGLGARVTARVHPNQARYRALAPRAL